jgi:ABC-type antimicrobial peptide transport system permease subunit
LHSALYGIKPFDPLSVVGALLIVEAIGVMAAWQPMRRAMNVDPAIVLKEE